MIPPNTLCKLKHKTLPHLFWIVLTVDWVKEGDDRTRVQLVPYESWSLTTVKVSRLSALTECDASGIFREWADFLPCTADNT